MDIALLKNSEMLPGFQVMPYAPVEARYNKDGILKNYFFIVCRQNYPFPVYIKVSPDFSTITETYPYYINTKRSFKYNLNLVRKNKTLKKHELLSRNCYYFSWNLIEKQENYLYRPCGDSIWLFNNKREAIKKYLMSKHVDTEGEFKDLKHIKNADYSIKYLNIDTNETTDILLGFNFGSDEFIMAHNKISLQ